MGVSITPGQVGAMIRMQAKQVSEAIRNGMRAAAEHAVTDLKQLSPVFDGNFKNAWRVAAPGYITGGTTVSVVNDAPYAGIIERGARPHGVNAEGQAALAEWVRRKLGISDEREIQSAVFLICRKIREEGVQGKFLVRDNLERFQGYLEVEVDRQLRGVK
jgi:hypothetical protein